MLKRVIQEQTASSKFSSTVSFADSISFSKLTPSQQEEYLQENFLNTGNEEGADNMLRLSEAIQYYGKENVISYTILV